MNALTNASQRTFFSRACFDECSHKCLTVDIFQTRLVTMFYFLRTRKAHQLISTFYRKCSIQSKAVFTDR